MVRLETIRKHRLFVLVCACVLLVRLLVLFTSQRHVDGDEAVIGIMAKHILDRGAHPLFFYGQPYGGGAAIEAYLATVPLLLFGVSSIPLKLVALAFSLTALTVTYAFCDRYLGRRTALLTTLILATASPLIEWHTKIRGGYAALPLLSVTVLWLFLRAYENSGPQQLKICLFLGLVTGIAVYNQALIVPTLFVLVLATIPARRVFWRARPLLTTAAGTLIGLLPLILFNLTHKFAHLRFVLGTGTSDSGPRLPHLARLFTRYLPGFFTPRNVDQIVTNAPVCAYVEYIVCLSLVAWLAWKLGGFILLLSALSGFVFVAPMLAFGLEALAARPWKIAAWFENNWPISRAMLFAASACAARSSKRCACHAACAVAGPWARRSR